MIKKIIINNMLSAVLTLPDVNQEKIPFILFLHGFGTDKNEVGNTFSITSEKLFEHNIGSLRLDFSGFGESQGTTSDTTIEKLLFDANLALDFLVDQHYVDINRIGLCGFSLGAGISVLVASKRHDAIKSLALLSPAGDLSADFTTYFGSSDFTRLANSEKEEELDLGWRKIKLKSKFIDSLKQYHLMKSITHYKEYF